MTKKKIDTNRPIYVYGRPAQVCVLFPNGNIAVTVPYRSEVLTFDKYGRSVTKDPAKLINMPVQERKIYAFYPQTGKTFLCEDKINSSMYGLGNVIQFEILFEDGEVVGKRFL